MLLSLAFDEYPFQSDEHRQKNERFLKLMVKTTNLVVMVVISSYVSMLILVLQLGHFMVMIDHSVIVLCVYLGYAHNARLYDKLCCARRSYRCCTVLCFLFADPTKIDDESLAVAIQENNRRHRFNSISHSLSLSRHRSLSASQSADVQETSKSLDLSPKNSNQSMIPNGERGHDGDAHQDHMDKMATLEMKGSERTVAVSQDIDIDCIEMYDGMDQISKTVALAPYSSAVSDQRSPTSQDVLDSTNRSSAEVVTSKVVTNTVLPMVAVATHSEHHELGVHRQREDTMDMEIVLEEE